MCKNIKYQKGSIYLKTYFLNMPEEIMLLSPYNLIINCVLYKVKLITNRYWELL